MAKKQPTPEIENLKTQLADYENRLKRAVADYQNLEKRVAKESSAVVKFANLTLIERLLEVYDNLDRAAATISDTGVNLIRDQLRRVLEEEGVARIEAQGKEFDAQLMECAEIVAGDKDVVMSVIQPGYTLHGRVLRPARVKVGSGTDNGISN